MQVEHNARIVIVDDDVAWAEMLCECLTAEGYDVHTEFGGLTALSTMLEVRPDLVLSDVMMPEMGGKALLTAMRENAYLREVPIIIMSALSERQIDNLGADYAGFLHKPFSISEMTAMVATQLDAGKNQSGDGSPPR